MNETMLSFKVDNKSQSIATEIKDLCARFTTDVIASCAYGRFCALTPNFLNLHQFYISGVEANSLKDPESEFRKHGKKIFHFTFYRAIEFSSMFFLPEIVSFFKFKVSTLNND